MKQHIEFTKVLELNSMLHVELAGITKLPQVVRKELEAS